MTKEVSCCVCWPSTLIIGKSYYQQILLEECKCVLKEKKG